MTKIETTLDGQHKGILHRVRGAYITEGGLINTYARRYMLAIVDADGIAWPYMHEDTAYNRDDFGDLAPLRAEMWGDGIYFGRQFSPDVGELERCGIKFELCGSAAQAS